MINLNGVQKTFIEEEALSSAKERNCSFHSGNAPFFLFSPTTVLYLCNILQVHLKRFISIYTVIYYKTVTYYLKLIGVCYIFFKSYYLTNNTVVVQTVLAYKIFANDNSEFKCDLIWTAFKTKSVSKTVGKSTLI